VKLPASDSHFTRTARGRYQHRAITAALAHTPGRDLVIDVGAHVGFWSDVFAQSFQRVVAIEPIPENFNCLVHNVPFITYINKACSDAPGTVRLHNPAPHNSGAWETGDGVEVETITIDSLGLDPDLIKIDVQGYEQRVIDGALATIDRCHPVLCVEAVKNDQRDDRLIAAIEALGYRVAEQIRKDFIFVWGAA
jgi:FkbM family methyltransferase